MAHDVWDDLGNRHTGRVYINTPIPKLVEMAITRGEGMLTSSGALRVSTGKYTGRSPNDKFIVDSSEIHNDIWWDNNQRISETVFNNLYNKNYR